MTETTDDGPQSLVTVAKAVRTRGLKGEIVAELLTDFPDRFEAVDKLILVSPTGKSANVELEDYWFQGDRVVLKIGGYDNQETASQLIGCEFAVPESDIVELPADQYYDWQLEGCAVKLITGEVIGTVRGVVRTGGPEILAVAANDGKEYLVPLAEGIVTTIDPATKTIIVDPPTGLLDL